MNGVKKLISPKATLPKKSGNDSEADISDGSTYRKILVSNRSKEVAPIALCAIGATFFGELFRTSALERKFPG